MTERVELEVDPGTAEYLRNCAHRRGESVAAAAARQLRQLALAESTARHAEWLEAHPTFFEDAEAERIAAGAV